MAELSQTNGEDVEKDVDNFEDAQDTASPPQTPLPKSTVDLPPSLTDGEPSSATSTPKGIKVPSIVDAPEMEESGPGSSDVDHKEKIPPQSPLLTSHCPSTESLKEVHLDGAVDDAMSESIPTSQNLGEKDSNVPPSPTNQQSKSRGLSGTLPTMPWAPSPSKPHAQPPATSAPPKKLGMSFSWLSRNGSGHKDAAPPPAPPQSQSPVSAGRRNTVTSVHSLSSNPELMISKFEQEHDATLKGVAPSSKDQRESLRERFKMLRMREESGIKNIDESGFTSPGGVGALAGLMGRSTSVGLGIASPTSMADEKDGGPSLSPLQSPVAAVPPVTMNPTINASLAPGTASGVSAGPSAMMDPAVPVDWDLWQSVVYEGPSAVARTSTEELSRAIASGIPSAIRGVVWQVLAQSKNEELEGVYRELVVRGTEKDRDNIAASNGHLPQSHMANGHLKEKQPLASSASSIHSDHSTPVGSGMRSASPAGREDSEATLRIQTALLAEKKQKAKEEGVAISKLEKVIKKDLGARTSYSKYATAAGLQEGLFGVCKAYALFDEGVGYAQGMNFLVMPLLFNMPEEEAFCLLVRMMNQCHLREMFIQDMPGLHLHLYQFERLLEDLEPALYCHLHRRQVTPQLYATQWFLTLFAYRFPLQLVLRVYDLILSEGLEGAILKFGIALMQQNRETLLGMNDMLSLTSFLKDRLFDVYIDQTPTASSILESGFFGSSGGIDKEIYRADVMVQDACTVKITPDLLKMYTSEWEERRQLEKEREAELETLRSLNASLALKVRSLEQRTETSDTEHVEMASELVRTKVENQELHDSNESYKGQVEELRSLVNRQPQEVEHRLKAETDRIMQRNVEVQNENRGLEEQMAEMEKELVATKMQFAEIHSEHEGLKQRWIDLRKAIGA